MYASLTNRALLRLICHGYITQFFVYKDMQILIKVHVIVL